MIKKLLLILLFPVILLGQTSGSGTVGDPYILTTAEDFDDIRTLGLSNKYYELGADIDFTVYGAIASFDFNGASGVFSLDGNGYTISNMPLTLLSTSAGSALFARTSAMTLITIININFDNCSAELTTQVAGNYAFLVGTNNIEDITISNILITNTTLDFTPTTSGGTWSFGFILGNTSADNAGLYIRDVSVKRCSLIAQPAGTPTLVVGGIAGNFSGGPGSGGPGGFAVIECYIRGTTSSFCRVGGIFGILDNITAATKMFSNCYVLNTTLVQASSATATVGQCGGLVGYMDVGTGKAGFDSCYTAGLTITANSTSRGTLIGRVSVDVPGTIAFEACYAEEHATLIPVGTETGVGTFIEDYSIETEANMKLQATYVDWDFTDIWAINASLQEGYPYLLGGGGPSITITAPAGGEIFTYSVPITVTWTGPDSAFLFYSYDNGANYTFVDTVEDNTYNWLSPVEAIGSGIKLKIYTIAFTFDESAAFNILAEFIDIIYPTDSTGTIDVGDIIGIQIKAIGIDTLSVFYGSTAIGPWISIKDTIIAEPLTLDTILVNWVLPNLYGDIYIHASQTTDTTLYYTRETTGIGTQMPSQPAICWTAIEGTPVEYRWSVDQSCGLGLNDCVELVTGTISDMGEGYDYLRLHCDAGTNCAYDDCPEALRTASTWLATATDTTETHIEDFYPTQYTVDGSAKIYKQRSYAIVDSVLTITDLRNSIICTTIDLKPFYDDHMTGGWRDNPTMEVYNVQRSKLQGDTLGVDTCYECLNDVNFSPVMLLSAANSTRSGVTRTFELLPYPNNADPATDTQRIFASVSTQRNYFRGIHPKAEKN